MLLPDSSPISDRETTFPKRCENSTGFQSGQRIDFKLATIMHGIVHGSAPEYLRNKVTPVSDLLGRCHLRSAAHGLFHVPRIRTRHGSRAFSVAGPTVWNSLPQTIRNISSVVTFKKQLKTHLFNLIYNV